MSFLCVQKAYRGHFDNQIDGKPLPVLPLDTHIQRPASNDSDSYRLHKFELPIGFFCWCG